MINLTVFKTIQLLHFAERLKNELRHGWTSLDRQESVADHSWRLALMVILCAEHLDSKINIEKALKMAIIHDLGEASIGDVHYLENHNSAERKQIRAEKEKQAIEDIRNLLNNPLGNALAQLWNEFEFSDSEEAKFVRALDKLEAYLQHNEGPMQRWLQSEMESVANYLDPFCDYDSFLKQMKECVIDEAKKKFKSSGIDLLALGLT